MTKRLKSDEALSHGFIQDHKGKREESKRIADQIAEFFRNGGEIEEHPQDNDAAFKDLKRRLNHE